MLIPDRAHIPVKKIMKDKEDVLCNDKEVDFPRRPNNP